MGSFWHEVMVAIQPFVTTAHWIRTRKVRPSMEKKGIYWEAQRQAVRPAADHLLLLYEAMAASAENLIPCVVLGQTAILRVADCSAESAKDVAPVLCQLGWCGFHLLR